MKPQVKFRLTPSQKGRLKKLRDKVNSEAQRGFPGAVIILQPWETTHMAGLNWDFLYASFLPNEIAQKIQDILMEYKV